MTREERIEKLRHLITCMKCEVDGKSCDNNCPTQYYAGNMGEIIENLEEIAKALEQEHCEDAISRADAIKALEYELSIELPVEVDDALDKYRTAIKGLLNAIYNMQKKAIEELPSTQPERKGTSLSTVCLLCKKPAVTFNTEDDIPYTNYSYCEDCLRKGLKLLKEQKKNSQTQSERKKGQFEEWKNDFKRYIKELTIPRDDYKGIMEYIDEVPYKAESEDKK